MKKCTDLFLIILLTACLCNACGNKATTDNTESSAPEAKTNTNVVTPDNNSNEHAKDETQPSTVASNAPGVECTERSCQCGTTTCAKNEICKDGQCYCGQQSFIDENYACKDVNTAKIIRGVYENYERKYVCQSAEGCTCGETTCPQNAACENGQCVCGATTLAPENTGYACNLVTEKHYDWVCRESNGCPCGSITAAVNMGCNGKNATCLGSPVPGRGLACRPKALGPYKYHLACFKDECDCYGKSITKDEVCQPLECEEGYTPGPKGCMCGSEVGDKDGFTCTTGKGGKSVKECIPTADYYCPCGEEKCLPFQVCKKGECVDRVSMKANKLPETDYSFENGFYKCINNDGCTCGKPSKSGKPNCEVDKYCINDSCRKDRYFRKVGEKVLYYKFNESSDAANAKEYLQNLWALMFIDESEPLCKGEWLKLYQEVDGKKVVLCEDPQYRDMTIGTFLKDCGIHSQPENTSNLYCRIDYLYTTKPNEDTGWAPTVIRVLGWGE